MRIPSIKRKSFRNSSRTWILSRCWMFNWKWSRTNSIL